LTRSSARAAGTLLFVAGVTALLVLERRRPLRRPVEPGVARLARNLLIGAATSVVVSKLERPIVEAITRAAEERRFGLLPRLPLPHVAKTALALVLMDYTLYWWHVLLHRVPFLWRLHEPHHADRDLDTSTGIRFHFTEFLASIPWRCAQVALIGVGPGALALWRKLTLVEVLFHHSNLRLPRALERVLSRFVVTPRVHGLHHSIVRDERDSNFSSGLAVWDDLHGTHRRYSRDDVIVGLPNTPTGQSSLVDCFASPFRQP
jgi:sterol desaturase/sphingolipid hydroxylase (fatty acid hydroxylase superfamily)